MIKNKLRRVICSAIGNERLRREGIDVDNLPLSDTPLTEEEQRGYVAHEARMRRYKQDDATKEAM